MLCLIILPVVIGFLMVIEQGIFLAYPPQSHPNLLRYFVLVLENILPGPLSQWTRKLYVYILYLPSIAFMFYIQMEEKIDQ